MCLFQNCVCAKLSGILFPFHSIFMWPTTKFHLISVSPRTSAVKCIKYAVSGIIFFSEICLSWTCKKSEILSMGTPKWSKLSILKFETLNYWKGPAKMVSVYLTKKTASASRYIIWTLPDGNWSIKKSSIIWFSSTSDVAHVNNWHM